MDDLIIITLSNGVRVGNFSSPHAFTFEDGSVLPAVSNEESNRLKVTFHETTIEKKYNYKTVSLDFSLSGAIYDRMYEWATLELEGKVDVVLCPLPMITALKDDGNIDVVTNRLFRAIRMKDRIKKEVCIDTFSF
jgi:hypothetical protein